MQTKCTLEYIPAGTEDVGYLMDLRKATMAVHFDNSDDHQTEEMLLERVLYRLDCAKLIIINGRRAGLLKAIKEGPEWELCQIQLEKEFQGQGIGGDIIKELLREAQDQGAGVVLHVLKANPARRLYEKLGFVTIREQNHGYLMRSDRTIKA
jgi:ribosomal protein S18 acetylase RimI-like enzyme